jgi:hypothetical protein
MRGFESLPVGRSGGTEFWQPYQQYQLALIYIDAVDRNKLTAIVFVSDCDVLVKPIATFQTHFLGIFSSKLPSNLYSLFTIHYSLPLTSLPMI